MELHHPSISKPLFIVVFFSLLEYRKHDVLVLELHDFDVNRAHQSIELLRKCEWISVTSEDLRKKEKKNDRCQFCQILTHLLLSLRLSHHSSIDQLSIIVRWFYCGWFFCNVFAHCPFRVYQIFIQFYGPTSFHHRSPLIVLCVCLRYCENVQIFNIFGVNKIISIDYSILCAIHSMHVMYGKKKKWGEDMTQWKRLNGET